VEGEPVVSAESVEGGASVESEPGKAVAAALGIGPWVLDGEWRLTQVTIGPEACHPGTDRPLTGVLFAYLDGVAGSPPSGPMNPTVDLQIRFFAPPRPGTIRFRARTLRLGRTIYVGEVELHQGEDPHPFGVGLATFMNQPVPFPERAGAGAERSRPADHGFGHYARLAGARRVGSGRVELTADLNTVQGTVSGATLGLLAEEAVLDLLGAATGIDELDVRFLHKVKAGPLLAVATVLGRRGDVTTVRVEVVDQGDSDRLVTYALAVCRDLAPLG
jgi:acyl-coenzyme A thioesterase PaaI-like protein